MVSSKVEKEKPDFPAFEATNPFWSETLPADVQSIQIAQRPDLHLVNGGLGWKGNEKFSFFQNTLRSFIERLPHV
jgi:hypothetical protein